MLAYVGLSGLSLAQDLTLPASPPKLIGNAGRVDVKTLADDSSLILRGRVVGSEPRWVGKVIYTFYDVAVQETLKGSMRPTVSVAVPGGALGSVQLIVPQAPALSNGDELVFFGRAFAGERSSFEPTGSFAGLMPIVPAAGSPAAVSPRGKPEDVEAFLDEVRALSARK